MQYQIYLCFRNCSHENVHFLTNSVLKYKENYWSKFCFSLTLSLLEAYIHFKTLPVCIIYGRFQTLKY